MSDRRERALTPRIAKKNFITMQNEEVKAEERPKGACLDASYCKKKFYNYAKRGSQGRRATEGSVP